MSGGIRNISNNPADRRGVGLTFLGMMSREDSGNPLVDRRTYVSRVEFEETIAALRAEIEALKIHWYSRWWAAFKQFFNNNRGE